MVGSPAAGTATVTGRAPVSAVGTVRVTAVAGPHGELSIDIPEGLYDAVVEPPPGFGQTVTAVAVDLRPGQPDPAQLTTALPGRITGQIVDPRSSSIACARLVATPIGFLAAATSATTATTAAGDGSFELHLPAGGDHDLVIMGPDTAHARRRLSVRAPQPDQNTDLGVIPLTDTLAYTGQVILGSRGASGMILHLLCAECEFDPNWPLAEALSNRDGYFVLRAPDPGVTASTADLIRRLQTRRSMHRLTHHGLSRR
ncbi:MAG: hypothetical protein MJE77_01540 [Proteobacteria bacterium]|nr:hypothetical protein [Pseudomonadota bacterium]